MIKDISFRELYIYSLWLYFIAVPLGTMNIGALGSFLKIIGFFPFFFAVMISEKLRFTFLHRLYFVYVVLAGASILWSINQISSLGRAITLLELFLLMCTVNAVNFDDEKIALLKKGLVLSSRITVVLLFMFGSLWEGRLVLSGIIHEDPNYLCMYFSFGVVNAVDQFFKDKKKKKRLLFLGEISMYLYAVLLSGSRGGLISIMVCLLLSILLCNPRKIKKGKSSFFRVVFIIAVFYALTSLLTELSPVISERYTIDNVVQSGGAGRTKIWQNGMDLFQNSSLGRQVFGYGAATNLRAMQQAGYHNAAVMHNIFFETLVELGVVGFLCYVFMIGNFVIKAAMLDNKYSFCVIMGFVVMSFSTSLYAFKPYVNIMIFIIINTMVQYKPILVDKCNYK